ncbi:MAG TPA: esterase-like activity of phytase family protein [Vicinamibacterales bacterium]|nr:esterase-like activity of phytase family protein [Vicinamibacterales bacterium]
MRRIMSAIFLVMLAVSATSASDAIFQLSGWAEIPSTYRHPGPTSGQFTTPNNGVTPPYDGQPIPGFSGMIPAPTPGSFFALPDNGFGAQGNSADFVLGFYEVTPTFKTVADGTTTPGPVAVHAFTPFSDPFGLLDSSFITGGPVYERDFYYSTGPQIPVAPSIKAGNLLTGADFDVESIARMNDGSFWVGEEFGPYLLHFNAQGQLLSRPVRHPVLRAPQNPDNVTMGPFNLPSSRGFEAMTRNADGSKLYVTTEASILAEPDKRLLEIYEFDTVAGRYTGKTFTYAKDSSDFITGAVNNATNIFVTGDMTHVADDRYIMIERDDFQGPPSISNPPRQKKLYLFDLNEQDANGVLGKRLLVDLLDIEDPEDIGGPLPEIPDDTFSFPLQSVESVTPIDAFTLLVGLDNNYPGGNGRIPGTPDDTEIITIRSKVPLRTLHVQPCKEASIGARNGFPHGNGDKNQDCR